MPSCSSAKHQSCFERLKCNFLKCVCGVLQAHGLHSSLTKRKQLGHGQEESLTAHKNLFLVQQQPGITFHTGDMADLILKKAYLVTLTHLWYLLLSP